MRLHDEEVWVLHELERRVDGRGEPRVHERAIEARRPSRRGLSAAGGRAAQRDGEGRERGRSRIRSARRLVADLNDRKRAAGAANDDTLLAVLRRLGRLRRLDRHLRIERAERRGRAIEKLVGGRIARDDEIRVVRRVVAAVMRIKAVSSHQLDLIFAADHTLRVGMARERDRLQLLAEEERRIVLESLALAHDDVALCLGLLHRDERVAHAI